MENQATTSGMVAQDPYGLAGTLRVEDKAEDMNQVEGIDRAEGIDPVTDNRVLAEGLRQAVVARTCRFLSIIARYTHNTLHTLLSLRSSYK